MMVKRRRTVDEPLNELRRSEDPAHGYVAAALWLKTLQLQAVPRWHVEVTLEASSTTKFNLNVYAEAWGFAFHHARRSSWIRITDIPFVDGRDDFGLLEATPDLNALGGLLSQLETVHAIELPRSNAIVRSNVPNATRAVRRWLEDSSTIDHWQEAKQDGRPVRTGRRDRARRAPTRNPGAPTKLRRRQDRQHLRLGAIG
jgi:hypothetical protein